MRKDADLTEQEIKEKVDRFFRRDSRIHDSRIRVDVEGRSVRLEGEVRNTQAFRAAENVAYTVMGVKTVDRGVVTLSGSVQDYAAANAAHDALLYIPGVRGIVNQITVG